VTKHAVTHERVSRSKLLQYRTDQCSDLLQQERIDDERCCANVGCRDLEVET
jgi:hypothetical protein